MRSTILLSILLYASSLVAAGTHKRRDTHHVRRDTNSMVNMGYYTNWSIYQRKFYPWDIPFSSLTHILYAFAGIDPNTGKLTYTDQWSDEQIHYTGDSWTETGNNLYGNFKQFLALKKTHRTVKLLVSIGGWGSSAQFAGMISTPEKQATFVQSCVDFLANNGLDGIDIDWEYPENASQASAYVALVRDLRAALTAYQARVGSSQPFLLTIAAPCGQANYNNIKMSQMAEYLDLINLMAYDYAGPWLPTTGHQAKLYGTPPSTSDCVSAYLAGGVPSRKLVLGMPTYGRGFANTDGIGSSYNGNGAGTWGETGLYDYKALPQTGMTEYYDASLGASWAYDAQQRLLVSYDNVQVAKQKVDYLKQKNLAGAMFWEISGDFTEADKSLIKTTAARLGTLESSMNHINYPFSKWDNVRGTNGQSSSSSSSTSSATTTTSSTTTTSTSTSTSSTTTTRTTSTSTTTSTAPTPTKAALGRACTSNAGCQSGVCHSGFCVSRSVSGVIGTYCNENEQCVTGRCLRNACEAKREPGAYCTVAVTCLSGVCTSNACVSAAGKGPLDSYCNDHPQCASGRCLQNKCAEKRDAGAFCTVPVTCLSGVCNAGACVSQAGKGALESYCNDHPQCTSGRCVQNKCTEKRGVGSYCTVDVTCLSGRCVGNACAAAGALDSYCTEHSQCDSGRCLKNKCTEKRGNGSYCTVEVTCLSGKCVNNACAAAAGTVALDSYCTEHEQCATGRCLKNKCTEKRAPGAYCTQAVTCASGVCSGEKCVPAAGAGTTGQYCNAASQCESRTCSNNACTSKAKY